MEAMLEDDVEAGTTAGEVFSLTTILEPSTALAAARRLYAQNRAGLRFFCENRRVVSVEEAEAFGEALDAAGESELRQAATVGANDEPDHEA